MTESREPLYCAPRSGETHTAHPTPHPRATGSTEGMVRIGGGSFWLGTGRAEGFPDDGEGPEHEVRQRPFLLAARSKNTPDSSTGHIGVRCARDAD